MPEIEIQLRDVFAGQFMAAMLSRPDSKVDIDLDNGIGFNQARVAYEIADAMIAARSVDGIAHG